MQITTDINARAGLLGNPSDGFFGKTLSCLVGNFRAQVTMTESDRIRLLPSAQCDPTEFDSMAELNAVYTDRGYYGGLRLLQAACKRFASYCSAHNIVLDAPNFSICYATNIPQMVGLAGSSAIVIATLRSLLRWYDVEEQFLQPVFPSIALAAEVEELGINAGLQDRVIQTYGGAMFMDFDEQLIAQRGYGAYTRVDPSTLPPLYLAYVLNPSDSGTIHSDVRRRWDVGDAEVREAMRTFAGFAQEGKTALAGKDFAAFSYLTNEAFQLRRKIYGDVVLGPDNLRMVELANRHGLTGTTCGSGGAIAGVLGEDDQNTAFASDLEAEGFRFLNIQVGPEYPWNACCS